MTPRKYVLGFVTLLIALLVLTALFNRAIDPFWYYRDVTLIGINDVKTEFYSHERQVKPAVVQRGRPSVLIFGSSYAEVGFDPLHPALRAIGKSYNFALAGAQWDVVSCAIQFSLTHDAGLRQIILGVHPQAMAAQDCAKRIEEMERPDERAFLLSYSALEASLKTVGGESPSHTVEGKMFYFRGRPGTASRFHQDLQKCPAVQDAGAEDVDLAGLREIVRLVVERRIALKLVVYPRHAMAIEREYQCGLDRRRWHVLRQLAALMEQEGKGLVELWDFEGYHDIGTEPVSEAPGKWWQDPAHFNSEFGDIMLNEMFALAVPSYGTRITAANLAVHEDAERKTRVAYIAGHPEFLQQLETLSPIHAK